MKVLPSTLVIGTQIHRRIEWLGHESEAEIGFEALSEQLCL